MKHGPNALIDEGLPVVVVDTREEGDEASELRYENTHSNIVEVKAREGQVISVLTEGDEMSAKVSDHVISIPESSDLLSPILPSSRCNCSPTTSRSGAAATLTNRATSPSP